MKKFIATCILTAASFGAHSLANAADAVKSQYKADVAAADADYKTAKAKCKPLKGNEQDVCDKEAKATHETALADAKAKRKTKDANKDAAKTTNDADYQVAIEKCDALKSAEKDKCTTAAKAKYGK